MDLKLYMEKRLSYSAGMGLDTGRADSSSRVLDKGSSSGRPGNIGGSGDLV